MPITKPFVLRVCKFCKAKFYDEHFKVTCRYCFSKIKRKGMKQFLEELEGQENEDCSKAVIFTPVSEYLKFDKKAKKK